MSIATDTFILEAIWLQESSDEDLCCERMSERCPNEAVYRVTWIPDGAPDRINGACTCGMTSMLYCLPCYEFLTSPGSWVVCSPGCDGDIKPYRVEKIRATR